MIERVPVQCLNVFFHVFVTGRARQRCQANIQEETEEDLSWSAVTFPCQLLDQWIGQDVRIR